MHRRIYSAVRRLQEVIPTSRRQAEALRHQALQDLEELEHQLGDGEIDLITAAALREVYLDETEEADRVLASQPEEPTRNVGVPVPFLSRRLVGITAVVVVLAAVLASAAGLVTTRTAGAPLTGGFEGIARSGFDQTASEGAFDPAGYSDETLEAVVAANANDPQIAGMRIALADRYFARGDYQSAFPHYQAALESDPAPSAILVATALSRVGWIVYEGNGEVDLALGLFDQALALRPDDPLTTYLKATVLWCSAGRPEEAVRLLEEVASSTLIDEQARARVKADVAAAREGRSCD